MHAILTPFENQHSPLKVAKTLIKPKDSTKYLGVHINKKLNFKEHMEYTIGKGVTAASALTQLTNTTSGLMVSRMEYALPVWYNLIHEDEERCQGAVGMARKMSKPQCLACKVMASGLRLMSMETLGYHINVLPTHLCMNLAAYKFAVRLCTLSPSHSLQKVVTHCKQVSCFHWSLIHYLMAAFEDLHKVWKTISAGRADMIRSTALKFSMADFKKSAEQDVAKFLKGDHYIYSDRSGFKAKIGMAAWMQPLESAPNGEVLHCLHLGPETHHTVFEVELVGTLLAIDIIKSTSHLTKATILLDSQAAILVLQSGNTKLGK
ncbi:uncharacterized protein EV420DRAFT_1721464 [Desarmillaria tabescens]|uniref:RNase H type-1 domain-containing protein n=1 Tax=Armillaria tabescens TaxID=1929756 RepID=A0AA39JP68_ARMTA|nr:uncharacterized protein EV420DRAFT_1721464 [Desarmillaria tabescens]KAK0444924.1 hypothetical protein EV420DRAFT_1721464 [Desarmillaria tabescens]